MVKIADPGKAAREVVYPIQICKLGTQECHTVQALFDTGARHAYLSREWVERHGIQYSRYPQPKLIPLAVKGKYAQILGSLEADVILDGCRITEHGSIKFDVVEGLGRDAIIGWGIMEPYEIYIDPVEWKPKLKHCPPRMELI